MIKKFLNWLKQTFTPTRQKDEHIEFYEDMPKPDIPMHKEKELWSCDEHPKFKHRCPKCKGAPA